MSSDGARRGRFPWVLTVCTAVAMGLLIALGVWQVQRMQWKNALIAAAEAAAGQPPAPLAAVMAGPAPEFRRVVLTCPGLATAPYVELQSIHEGQAGVRLISACPTVGAEADVWLVDRGFVADVISARPPVEVSDRPLTVTAVVRETPPPGAMTPAPSNGRFFGRDNAAMASALGVAGPVRPETLFAVTSSNPEWLALLPTAPPAAFSNNHLGYAITWFGLALALAGVYAALLRRKLTS